MNWFTFADGVEGGCNDSLDCARGDAVICSAEEEGGVNSGISIVCGAKPEVFPEGGEAFFASWHNANFFPFSEYLYGFVF